VLFEMQQLRMRLVQQWHGNEGFCGIVTWLYNCRGMECQHWCSNSGVLACWYSNGGAVNVARWKVEWWNGGMVVVTWWHV